MVVYISGGITGVEEHSIMFDRAETILKGHQIVNPSRFYKMKNWSAYMDYDLWVLSKCDAIYMMKGYKKSYGAQIELLYAKKLG